MATSSPITRKNFEFQYRGGSPLALGAGTTPWQNKLLRLYRSSTGTATALQSYAGSFGGQTPGGAVTTLMPGLCYRVVAGLYDGSWSIPDAVLVDDIPTTNTLGNVYKLSDYGVISDTDVASVNSTQIGSDQTDKIQAVYNLATGNAFATVVWDVRASFKFLNKKSYTLTSVVTGCGGLQLPGYNTSMWRNANRAGGIAGALNVTDRQLLFMSATDGGEWFMNGNGHSTTGAPQRTIASDDKTGWCHVWNFAGVDGLVVSGCASLNGRAIMGHIRNCRNVHVHFTKMLQSERIGSGVWPNVDFNESARHDGIKWEGPLVDWSYEVDASFSLSDDCCSVQTDGDYFGPGITGWQVGTDSTEDQHGSYGLITNGRVKLTLVAGAISGAFGWHGIRLMSRSETMRNVSIELNGRVEEFMGVQDNYTTGGYSRPNATDYDGHYENITVSGNIMVPGKASTYERTAGWYIRAGSVKRQSFASLTYTGVAPFCLISGQGASVTTPCNVDLLYANDVSVNGATAALQSSFVREGNVQALAGNAFVTTGPGAGDGVTVTQLGVYEEDSSYIQANSLWKVGTSTNGDHSNNRCLYAQDAGALITVPIRFGIATRVSVGTAKAIYGSLVVLLDNQVIGTIDQHASPTEQSKIIWTSPSIPAGAHTLTFHPLDASTTVYDILQFTAA